MRHLLQLVTPAGALAMLFGLWLPWADVSCGQIRTNPNYWQLANYDGRLYVLLALVVLIVVCGFGSLFVRRKFVAACAGIGALAAVVAWCYLWLKKDELVAYQAEMVAGGGDLGQMLKDLQVQAGAGFKLYLAGALLALAGAALSLARGEPDPPR
jgi:hypothetical protein